jgi:hypothetical protein
MASRLVKRVRKAPSETSKDPLQRARDNYNRRVALPVSMAHAMSAFLDEARKVNKSRRARLQGALELALAELPGLQDVGDRAHIASIGKDGTVHIAVDSPTLAHELGVVYKLALLNKLRDLLHGKDSLSGITVKAARTKPRASTRNGSER